MRTEPSPPPLTTAASVDPGLNSCAPFNQPCCSPFSASICVYINGGVAACQSSGVVHFLIVKAECDGNFDRSLDRNSGPSGRFKTPLLQGFEGCFIKHAVGAAAGDAQAPRLSVDADHDADDYTALQPASPRDLWVARQRVACGSKTKTGTDEQAPRIAGPRFVNSGARTSLRQ